VLPQFRQPTPRADLSSIIPTFHVPWFDPPNNIMLSITVAARSKTQKSSPTQTTQGMDVCLCFSAFVSPCPFKQSYRLCIRFLILELIHSERERVTAQSVKVLDGEYSVKGKHYEGPRCVRSFLQLPVTSSYYPRHFLLTLSQCTVILRDHVSRPFKSRNTIIVFYTSMFRFFVNRRKVKILT
jgi:hypothetical protein